MEAIEFINAVGIDRAREELKNIPDGHDFQYSESTPIIKDGNFLGFDCKVHLVSGDRVKRLVESFDLIENLGGYDEAVDQLYYQKEQHNFQYKLGHGEIFSHECWAWEDIERLGEALDSFEEIIHHVNS